MAAILFLHQYVTIRFGVYARSCRCTQYSQATGANVAFYITLEKTFGSLYKSARYPADIYREQTSNKTASIGTKGHVYIILQTPLRLIKQLFQI